MSQQQQRNDNYDIDDDNDDDEDSVTKQELIHHAKPCTYLPSVLSSNSWCTQPSGAMRSSTAFGNASLMASSSATLSPTRNKTGLLKSHSYIRRGP